MVRQYDEWRLDIARGLGYINVKTIFLSFLIPRLSRLFVFLTHFRPTTF